MVQTIATDRANAESWDIMDDFFGKVFILPNTCKFTTGSDAVTANYCNIQKNS